MMLEAVGDVFEESILKVYQVPHLSKCPMQSPALTYRSDMQAAL